MKNLRRLNKKIDVARENLSSSIETLVSELEKLSGLKLVFNDFPGDGLGIALASESDNDDLGGENTFMPIGDLLTIIDEKGTFTEDDIVTSL